MVFFRFFRLPFRSFLFLGLSEVPADSRREKRRPPSAPVLRRAETCDVEEEAPLNLLKSSKLSLNLV